MLTMRYTPSILDPSFRYVPAAATSVSQTWRRFGWRPTTDEERRHRRRVATTRFLDEDAPVSRIEPPPSRGPIELRAVTARA